MRKILLTSVIAFVSNDIQAQSVGIGTTTPNASAQVDITSTNKGFLLPRMTTTQRILISNPVDGLLVYDSTAQRLYQYQNGIWRFLINNEYWVQSTTRNWVYNGTDSIGIGTTIPTQRLDVNGNIRTRDNLVVDNNVTATGIVSGGTLNSNGSLFVNGISSLNGNLSVTGTSALDGTVTTNGDVIVNNSGGTLQLRDGSNVNKGYFQLSGNNVRFGTNSGNTTGDLIIRMNGADRVTVRESGNVGIGNAGSPVYKLYVTGETYNDGDINVNGKVKRTSVTGSASMLPVCYGRVSSAGTVLSGTGNFTVIRSETGFYEISCPAITSSSIITASVETGIYIPVVLCNNGSAIIFILNSQEQPRNSDFHFVIYTP